VNKKIRHVKKDGTHTLLTETYPHRVYTIDVSEKDKTLQNTHTHTKRLRSHAKPENQGRTLHTETRRGCVQEMTADQVLAPKQKPPTKHSNAMAFNSQFISRNKNREQTHTHQPIFILGVFVFNFHYFLLTFEK
jgi:hypothetical protein